MVMFAVEIKEVFPKVNECLEGRAHFNDLRAQCRAYELF